MLTQYYNNLESIKQRLEVILAEELERRNGLGLSSPVDIGLNLIVEETKTMGSSEEVNGRPTIHLNVLSEIAFYPGLITRYEAQLTRLIL